jgi:plasmid rolling circle replication initiator protein Rep
MNSNITGEILQDPKKNGKGRNWGERRMRTDLLSESFSRNEMDNRAERTANCSTYLKFAECPNGHYKKLIDANFCRDRMCPMCNWRRTLKLQGQIFEIIHAAVYVRKMRFIFLTLTVGNVSGENLDQTLTSMLKGFKTLIKREAVDKYVIGYVRNFEITYNKSRDDYHPHIHALLGVQPVYFSCGYINQSKWIDLWQDILKLDYKPVVDVRTVKPNKAGKSIETAVAETGKYCAKDTDYIHEGDEKLTDKVVFYLANALKSRRLITFGKLFKTIHSQLHLQDVESESADLVNQTEHNCNCPICNSNLAEQLYKWYYAYKVYAGERRIKE